MLKRHVQDLWQNILKQCLFHTFIISKKIYKKIVQELVSNAVIFNSS